MPKNKSVSSQKVKLKVGRKLPKGDNITVTSFKARKINVPNQEKSFVEDSDKTPAANVSELLNKLNHPNENTRIHTLKTIRGLLESQNQEDHQHLAFHTTKILNETCRLILAREDNVRKEANMVICIILRQMASMSTKQDLPVLVTHIRCAATDLDMNVRRDAMNLVDILLDNMPETICHSKAMLNNFLGLISCQDQKKKTNHARRSLTISPDERITAQKWRMCVLKRLVKFLAKNCQSFGSKDNTEPMKFSSDDGLTYFKYEERRISSFSLQKLENIKENDDCNSSFDFVLNFLTQIKPLLFGIWIEALPLCKLGVGVSPENDVEVLAVVLEVFCHLIDWIDLVERKHHFTELMKTFSMLCFLDVRVHIMSVFPLEVPEKMKRKNNENELSQLGLKLNLNICKLFTRSSKDYNESLDCDGILEFLHQVLKRRSIKDPTTFLFYINTVDYFLVNDNLRSQCEPLLEELFRFNSQLKECDWRSIVLQSLFKHVLDFNFRHLLDIKSVRLWLYNLPTQLLYDEELRSSAFEDSVKKLSTRGYPPFLEGLQANSVEIISLLGSDSHGYVPDLIWAIPNLTGEHFCKLSQVLRSPNTSLHSVDYLLYSLHLRFNNCQDSGFTATDYVSFLFNTAIAAFQLIDMDELTAKPTTDALDLVSLTNNQLPFDVTSYKINPSSEWPRQQHIFKSVLHRLMTIPEQEKLAVTVQGFLIQFFQYYTEIPAHSAIAVLKLFNLIERKIEFTDMYRNLQSYISDLTLAFYLYEFALKLSLTEEEVQLYTYSSLVQQETRNLHLIISNVAQNVNYIDNADQARHIGYMLCDLLKVCRPSNEDSSTIMFILESLNTNHPEKHFPSSSWFNEIVHKLNQASLFSHV